MMHMNSGEIQQPWQGQPCYGSKLRHLHLSVHSLSALCSLLLTSLLHTAAGAALSYSSCVLSWASHHLVHLQSSSNADTTAPVTHHFVSK